MKSKKKVLSTIGKCAIAIPIPFITMITVGKIIGIVAVKRVMED